ncbi:hypothetical protein HYC85_003565 [Camellia sinensis]|uniref:HD domain-containing protein n=1 Tax=Camellia sinensis TaxID=4442 RepID=A0A7J7HU22_CAMSI|nr:hypothetical protein HYC85_003565 [Camellia sinensis]
MSDFSPGECSSSSSEKRPSAAAAAASILEEEAETTPQAEASSRGEGDAERPSTGLRSCEAETKQLPWASQSQSLQRRRLSNNRRWALGSSEAVVLVGEIIGRREEIGGILTLSVECSVNPSWYLHSLRLNSFDSSFSELELPHPTLLGFFEWPLSLLLHTHHHHHSASASSNGDSSSVPASSAIDFLSLCHRLKTTKRTGRVRRDVENPESIADHMYRMGLLALIASDIPGVDRDKCIKMAIVHDIAEAIVGDITPSDGVPKHEKSRREQEALDHMCKLLGGGQRAQEIGQLWMEYEENLSLEAKVVKDFNKVLKSGCGRRNGGSGAVAIAGCKGRSVTVAESYQKAGLKRGPMIQAKIDFPMVKDIANKVVVR